MPDHDPQELPLTPGVAPPGPAAAASSTTNTTTTTADTTMFMPVSPTRDRLVVVALSCEDEEK